MEIFQRKMNGHKKHDVESICFHLNKLFNTKQGTLKHMPKFGLPDIGHVCRGMPKSIAILKQSMTELIHQYEPRLNLIEIKAEPIVEDEYIFKLKIIATTKVGDELIFETLGNQQGLHVKQLL